MSTLVVGGGLMGLTSAQALVDQGEAVTILEAREGVALETSFANGGMLTPSMPEPWNSPGVYRHLAASLFDPRSSMKLRVHAMPSLVTWGIRFLRHSSRDRYEAACADNYRLACYSLAETQAITGRFALDYDRGVEGALSVFRNDDDFAQKDAVCRRLAELGMRYSVLTAEEMISLVPALADIRRQIHNGILYHDDECGDAHLFCRSLAPHFERAGGRIEYGVAVQRLLTDGARVVGVGTDRGERTADRVVVAAGTRSPALLAGAGVTLAVKPVKGYSVTVDVGGIDGVPTLPVLDDAMHAGMTPLGDRLRMVGTAEFTGFDTTINKVRTDNLYAMFEAILPGIAAQVDREHAVPWAGLRPMSYDGKPFIGATGIDGLFVNCGQGHLGWTMAMGSARLLADTVLGRPPAIDASPYSLRRDRR